MATTVADDVKESPRRLEDTVIPGPHRYVSFLKGLPAITDGDLTGIGVTILREHGSVGRDLLVPASSLVRYSALVRERLRPGSMNEIVGREQILFIVKLPDGAVRDLVLDEGTAPEIARLCSALNDDVIEATSDVPRYLARNPLYREVTAAFHVSGPEPR
jgi:hypothetical protein